MLRGGCPLEDLGWAGLAGLGWLGGWLLAWMWAMGAACDDFTIRELSGNYPGFGVAKLAGFGLAGLAAWVDLDSPSPPHPFSLALFPPSPLSPPPSEKMK